jgi:hypothetical protein
MVAIYFADVDTCVPYEPRGDDVQLPPGSYVLDPALDADITLRLCALHFLARAFRTLLPADTATGD